MKDDMPNYDDFSGAVRVFPLPNLVLYPHVVQPLHVFEPRYRQMTIDALADDRLLALALLQPGWEADYDGRPAIYPVVCLTHIEADQRLEDERFNILVRGLKRARVRREIHFEKSYRTIEIDVVNDGSAPAAGVAAALRKELRHVARPWFPPQEAAGAYFDKLLQAGLPVGVLVDLLAFAVPLTLADKQRLLDELDPERRANLLMASLTAARSSVTTDGADRPFPPGFSAN